MIKDFKELKVWEKSHQLTLDLYQVTSSFPKEELYGLVSQMRRCAISVSANIVEGCERQTTLDFCHFLNISQGSLEELKYYLLLSRDLKLISNEVYDKMLAKCDEIGRMIHGLSVSLKKRKSFGSSRLLSLLILMFPPICRLPLILTLTLLAACHLPLAASSGASFLKLGVGARALALGSAYTAVANDATALYWNPAGLARLEKKEVAAMHAQLFTDMRYDFLGYAHPLKAAKDSQGKVVAKGSNGNGVEAAQDGKNGKWHPEASPWTLGVGAAYLNQGNLEGRADDRSRSGDFTASDFTMTLGASRLSSGRSSYGVNLKLLKSTLAGYSSTGFALDLGFQSHLAWSHPLFLGMAVQNAGPQMRFLDQGVDLPLTLAGGVACPIGKWALISADLKHYPLDSRTAYNLGAEVNPVSMISIRTGYLSRTVSPTNSPNNSLTDKLSNLSGLGLGFGLKLGSTTLDYAFTPAGELGNSQRFSFSVKF